MSKDKKLTIRISQELYDWLAKEAASKELGVATLTRLLLVNLKEEKEKES